MNAKTTESAGINAKQCIFCSSTEELDVMYGACGAEPSVMLFKKNKRGKKENALIYELIKIKTGLSIWELVLCSVCKANLYGESIIKNLKSYKYGIFISIGAILSLILYVFLMEYVLYPLKLDKNARTPFVIIFVGISFAALIGLVTLPISIFRLFRTKFKQQEFQKNRQILTTDESNAAFLEAGEQVLAILEERKPGRLSGYFSLPKVPEIEKIASQYPNFIVEYLPRSKSDPIRKLLGVRGKNEDTVFKGWEKVPQ